MDYGMMMVIGIVDTATICCIVERSAGRNMLIRKRYMLNDANSILENSNVQLLVMAQNLSSEFF